MRLGWPGVSVLLSLGFEATRRDLQRQQRKQTERGEEERGKKKGATSSLVGGPVRVEDTIRRR